MAYPQVLGRRALFGLTLVLSSCSIIYELLLAQSLSATMGDTFLRYNTTIALYMASLGLGSLLCPAGRAEDIPDRLVAVEYGLALTGALSPLLVIIWDGAVFKGSAWLGLEFRGPIYQGAIFLFNHGLIVLIGILSGFELPMLMRLGSAGATDLSNQVLALDYLGTVVGAVLFPLWLLPELGVTLTAGLTGLFNALCGLYLHLFLGRRSGLRLTAYLALLGGCLGLFVGGGSLEQVLIDRVFLLRP